ncbi:hypothetical protein MMIC_P0303 [Mariprofundus micogutta]|uniref:SnoaL-like domain-containing protein n=1 Tax=Mariprofundus micogutta TaxID=1921010 RepID=A0A1L8CKH8_9PROT|nr:hypothetical protein [Mariprofundus micogutta]GAV19369.1 hypothetical protein MMIC_P0303 [Mariprofundus micogutta]
MVLFQTGLVRHCFLALLIGLVLSGCGNNDKQNIHVLLDARDIAVSNHHIGNYSLLLMPGYAYQGQSEFDVINRMNKLFEQFDNTSMQSSDRVIRFVDDEHAECEQNYLLRVQANGQWRQIFQRERILLTKTDTGWKISGGL